jgi:hypothetical protein
MESALLVDGDLDIPGRPVNPSSKPCHVVVTLRGIYYSGDDVGADWRFQVSVDGGTWLSGPVSLAWRNWLGVGSVLLDETRPGGCGLAQSITFFVRAREVDWGLFDDLGERLEMVVQSCDAEPLRRQLIMPVRVSEYFGRSWRPILRLWTRTAVLFFFFAIETRCA